MSDQAERPTDTWATVAHAPHCDSRVTSGADCDCWVRRLQPILDAVDAARAADAVQIAALTQELTNVRAAKVLVTWGDADSVIAKLVAERDAAQQEAQTLREALSDILWEVKDSSAAKKVAIAALVPRPQDRQ